MTNEVGVYLQRHRYNARHVSPRQALRAGSRDGHTRVSRSKWSACPLPAGSYVGRAGPAPSVDEETCHGAVASYLIFQRFAEDAPGQVDGERAELAAQLMADALALGA